MNAPDRSALVAQVVEQHRELFGTDDSRRNILPFVCAELNKIDGGEWGLLEKTDQGNFIPSDIIMYHSTGEIFDVLAGGPDRPWWGPLGPVANPAWRWKSAMLLDPQQPPAPPPPVSDDVKELFLIASKFVDVLVETTDALLAVSKELQAISEKGLRVHL